VNSRTNKQGSTRQPIHAAWQGAAMATGALGGCVAGTLCGFLVGGPVGGAMGFAGGFLSGCAAGKRVINRNSRTG